jgi:predicted nucleic acid-binding protein
MAVFYADASALVKLVWEEAESDALRAYLAEADVVSSELILTEVPRAVHRAAAQDPALPRDLSLERAGNWLTQSRCARWIAPFSPAPVL